MRRKKAQSIKKTVLSAVFSAISVVILWLGGLLGDLDLTFTAFASLVVVLALIEMGVKYALFVYAVTSALCLILFPTYFVTPMYILCVGIYPILKYLLEKLPRALSYLLKLVFVNAMLLLLIFLGRRLFGVEEDAALWIVLILGNVAFLLFDYAVAGLSVIYEGKIRKMLGIQKMLK